MRIVGDRAQRPILLQPSAERLEAGMRFVAEMAALGDVSTCIPKGVYRFRTQVEADEQRNAALASGMAARAAAARGAGR